MKLQADLILLLVEGTAAAIGIFIMLYLLVAITGKAPWLFGASNPVGQGAATAGTSAVNMLFSVIVLIYIVGVLVAGVSASYVNTNAAFAFVGVISLPIIIIVAVVLHNVFFQFTESTIFGGITAPVDTTILFEAYPVFALVGWIVIMIFTYGKPGAAGSAASNYGSNYG